MNCLERRRRLDLPTHQHQRAHPQTLAGLKVSPLRTSEKEPLEVPFESFLLYHIPAKQRSRRYRVFMIACALLEPFALWQAEQLEPELKDKPLVTLKKNKVVEVSSVARQASIEPGMGLDGARSRCSDLVIIETNDATLQHAWEDVLNRLYAFTDRIEPVKPGLVFLDVSEAEASLIAESFRARVALANNQEQAHLKALADVVEVKGIPVAVLRGVGLGKKSVERLHWLGISNLAELQRWSKAQLYSYFGKEAEILVRYLKGPYRRNVNRYTPPITLRASYIFEDAALEPWQLEPVIDYLASELQAQLEGRAASRLTLSAESQGLAFTATRVSKKPLKDERELVRVASFALADSGVQGLEVDKLTLTLSGLYRPSVQGALFGCRESVEEAVSTVEARFPGALLRFATVNPYLPTSEFSHRLVTLGRTESEVKREGSTHRRRSPRRSSLPRERFPSFTSHR